jgi:hypothetical protein
VARKQRESAKMGSGSDKLPGSLVNRVMECSQLV